VKGSAGVEKTARENSQREEEIKVINSEMVRGA